MGMSDFSSGDEDHAAAIRIEREPENVNDRSPVSVLAAHSAPSTAVSDVESGNVCELLRGPFYHPR
jgi:hypothetical protein